MSSAAVLIKAIPIRLKIESGQLRGQTFSFPRDRVSIGRDPENQVVVSTDLKMSRQHAEITTENGALWVRNLSQKNPMWVNDQEVTAHLIQGQVKVQLGETVFTIAGSEGAAQALPTFSATTPTADHLRAVPQASAARQQTRNHQTNRQANHQNAVHSARPQAVSGGSDKTGFYLVVGVVALGLAWLLMSETAARRKAQPLRTRDQVMLDLEKSESAIRDIEKKQEDTGQQTLQYKTAQEHYIKGFRDYRQGQYARAMSSFQAALSFYPQHDLAKKYLTLSRRKFDEIVQFNMIQGKRYKGKNNYRLCKAAYANVMIMMKDPNDTIYREAKQYYNECSLLLEGKY